MADNIERQDKGELVANCDQLQNDEVIVTTPVESRIMSIRGKQIMIDRDLAELYGVETKRLNEAVKRNIERFPERFRFQLTKEEMAELVANCDRFNSLKHSAVRSYTFTEQGVAMLSTVLRSENRNSCKHTNYGCICCNETFHGDKCRSFPTSFNNGVPSTGNAATLARIRQTYRKCYRIIFSYHT